MSEVDPFYTDTDLDIYGDERKAVYHYRSECEYGQKVKRDHNDVSGKGVGLDRARSAIERQPSSKSPAKDQLPIGTGWFPVRGNGPVAPKIGDREAVSQADA